MLKFNGCPSAEQHSLLYIQSAVVFEGKMITMPCNQKAVWQQNVTHCSADCQALQMAPLPSTNRRYIKTGGTDKCFSGSSSGHASGAQIELRQVSGLW